MIELILVRHGETIENSKGIIQGQTEGTLTEKGIDQNKRLAENLKDVDIDLAFSSPLTRAVKTAEQIIVLQNINLILDSRLTERNMGVLQGKKIPDFYDVTKEYEGMESLQDVFNRVQSFLTDLQKNYINKRILIVSHGITSLAISAIINKTQIDGIQKEKLLGNSTYSVLNLFN